MQNHAVIQPLLTQGARRIGLTTEAARSLEVFVAGIRRITLIISENYFSLRI